MKEATQPLTAKALVFEDKSSKYGIVVDSVESIVSFSGEDKIDLPESLYRDANGGNLGKNVKFAVEIQIKEETKTLMILDLDSILSRTGVGTDRRPAQVA